MRNRSHGEVRCVVPAEFRLLSGAFRELLFDGVEVADLATRKNTKMATASTNAKNRRYFPALRRRAPIFSFGGATTFNFSISKIPNNWATSTKSEKKEKEGKE